jgi:hypothetical protein
MAAILMVWLVLVIIGLASKEAQAFIDDDEL